MTAWAIRFSAVAAILFAVATVSVLRSQSVTTQQVTRVTIHAVDMPLGELLSLIEQQTRYTFAYNISALDMSRRVTLQATNSDIEYALRTILKDTGYTYSIREMHIVVHPTPPAVTNRASAAPSYFPVRDAETPAAVPAAERPAAQGTAPARTSTPERRPSATPARYAHSEQSSPVPVMLPSNKKPAIPQSPLLAVKTNLLFDVTATMNLGLEFRFAPKWTVELAGSYNPWSWGGNRKWKSIVVQPEFRRWLCDPFAGHFLGVHAHWAHYNYGNLPFGPLKTNRYQGDLGGVGFSYGYSWYIGRRWALEATVGVGYAYMDYQRFEHVVCGTCFGWEHKHYVGITKLGLNLSFLIK